MAKNLEPQFYWDPETGLSTCILSDGTNTYIGQAHCSEADQDMKSEKTGGYIAECRAQISYLTHIRDNEIKPKLAALKELYYSINQSKRFNPDLYEVHMLQKKIGDLDFELSVTKDMIATERKTLNTFMKQKADAYSKIRRIRESAKNN